MVLWVPFLQDFYDFGPGEENSIPHLGTGYMYVAMFGFEAISSFLLGLCLVVELAHLG